MQTIKWAANQRIEAVMDAAGVQFYDRASDDKAIDAGRIDFARCAEATKFRAQQDGFKKRGNDACASAETLEQRLAILGRLCDHYNSGTESWSLKAVSAKVLNRAAMYQAIATVRGMDASVVESKLRDKGDDFLRSYNAIAGIAAEYTRLTVRGADEKTENDLFAALDE